MGGFLDSKLLKTVERSAPGDLPPGSPHLFLLMECARPGAGSARHQLAGVREVMVGRGHERAVSRSGGMDRQRLALAIPDRRMSSAHARMVREGGSWSLEDLGSKNGTFLNGERVTSVPLADGDVIELGYTFFLYREDVSATADDRDDLDQARLSGPHPKLVTFLPPLARQMTDLEQIAASAVPVLLFGESGTGKEVVARAVHEMSGRAGVFVAVNCGALPENLVESELFGHKKGAFSGAIEDRPGLVRSADHGTLFLDEIGDLPLPSQSALLRVLQEREVVPVGTSRPVAVDFRLIAATHRPLAAYAEQGRFRSDLLARISGFAMTLPALRHRREDLGLISSRLLGRLGVASGMAFSCDAARALVRYGWPANIRELEKCLEAAAVLAKDGTIKLEHLPPSLQRALETASSPGRASKAAVMSDAPLSEEDAGRREELVAQLAAHQGNISAVARTMGKARMQIQRWVKRYGLDPESYRS